MADVAISGNVAVVVVAVATAAAATLHTPHTHAHTYMDIVAVKAALGRLKAFLFWAGRGG